MRALVRKLLWVEAIVIALTLIIWWAVGDGTLASLWVYLFRMGVATITLGLLVVAGATAGTRTETLAYLKPASKKRLLDDQMHRKGAYSVLNLLAMAGVIAMILAVLLREIATKPSL